MHVPKLLQARFAQALQGLVDDPDRYASMVRPTANPDHGDYQVNCAMPLSKQLGRKPLDVAGDLVAHRVVVVAGVAELFRVVRTGLRGAQVLFYPTAIGWIPSEKDEYGASQRGSLC